MTKKVLSLILEILMILPMAVACAETPAEGETTSENPDATTVGPWYPRAEV